MPHHPSLRLYITGQTPRSEQAVANLTQICEEQFGDQCDLDIVDVLEHPELAEEEKIIATPTLIRLSPSPCCRIIGDLSDREKVMMGLGFYTVPGIYQDHRPT